MFDVSGLQSVTQIRPATQHTERRTRRIHQHHVGGSRLREAGHHTGHARTAQARLLVPQRLVVDIVDPQSPLILHRCCQSEGLAAAARAQVHHHITRTRPAAIGDDLGPGVLHLEESAAPGRTAKEVRVPRNVHRPAADGVLLGGDALARQHLKQAGPVALEQIGPQRHGTSNVYAAQKSVGAAVPEAAAQALGEPPRAGALDDETLHRIGGPDVVGRLRC